MERITLWTEEWCRYIHWQKWTDIHESHDQTERQLWTR